MRVLLLATYEMGRQPFGLASPAAWLRAAGHEVQLQDLSRDRLDPARVRDAGLIACHVPMHTATRLLPPVLRTARGLNPEAHLCVYGLYAPLNEAHLRGCGAQTILGAEFEADLVALADRLARELENASGNRRRNEQPHDRNVTPSVSDPAAVATPLSLLTSASTSGFASPSGSAFGSASDSDSDSASACRRAAASAAASATDVRNDAGAGTPDPVPLAGTAPLPRLRFRVPDRRDLPPLDRYARVHVDGEARITGYTEATRGCKHVCRHCPIVPVYGGRFRAIPADTVLADVAQQVDAGARHITFGDPDFFNGPTHAETIVTRLAARHPGLTYDVTIKIEHLLAHSRLLPTLRHTGCLFITSAVESTDDAVLARLAKGHTRADFVEAAALCRQHGLHLVPTFVAFTPWTTAESYWDMLQTVRALGLVPNVSSVQWTIRLLIPDGSRLLALDEVRALVGPFDRTQLVYPWTHPDPRMDDLQQRLAALAGGGQRRAPVRDRVELFADIERLAREALGERAHLFDREPPPIVRAAIPYLDEPWYC